MKTPRRRKDPQTRGGSKQEGENKRVFYHMHALKQAMAIRAPLRCSTPMHIEKITGVRGPAGPEKKIEFRITYMNKTTK